MSQEIVSVGNYNNVPLPGRTVTSVIFTCLHFCYWWPPENCTYWFI